MTFKTRIHYKLCTNTPTNRYLCVHDANNSEPEHTLDGARAHMVASNVHRNKTVGHNAYEMVSILYIIFFPNFFKYYQCYSHTD